MSFDSILNDLMKISQTPKAQLAKYKAEGKKVIGVLPYYAQEELVYAAGMVPMGIWGSNTKTISRAREYCATFYCTIAQLALEMLLDGTMDQLDGIITPTICDTLRPMSQNFRVAMGDKLPVIFLAHPRNRFDANGLTFTVSQYAHIKAELEKSPVSPSPMRLYKTPSRCIIRAEPPAAGSWRWPRNMPTPSPPSADPLLALAKQFAAIDYDVLLYDPASAKNRRGEFVAQMVKDSGAQGLVLLMQQFCDPEEMEYPYLKKALDDAGIPHIKIGVDQQMRDFGQARTALQAFADVLALQ